MPSTGILFSSNDDWITKEWIDKDGWLKINTDVSTIGYIARTSLGHIVFAAGRQTEANLELEAETKAMKEAIEEAHQHGIRRVYLESDSSLLIQCLQQAQSPLWLLRALVLGISIIMKKFAAIQVLFVKKEANIIVDWLAIKANSP
uniref:RNase H type-1 domain-containing protein n=1 Tax=Ananas comosus var. bracteatus TaxID=296719 RepID=A0A6V7Q4G5_ANACO|nr:unnamed protein product [Ananas comosus var. bracteatus]